MITDAYNLAEVLFAAFIGAFAGGVGVFVATMAVRRDAALDRIEAAGDLGAARAAQIAMEASRSYLVLAPAYQAHTAEYRMVDPDHDSTPDFDAWLATANAEADAAVPGAVDTAAALDALKQRADAAGLILGPGPDEATPEGATPTRRRVKDTDGVVFTEHPSGRWVMEDDPDSYIRLIDTWDSYEQLLGDAVELTELEPAPAYTEDEVNPTYPGVHELASAWGGVPGECGASCACGETYDGFDTIAEATAFLDRHYVKANAATGTDLEPVTADDLAPIGPDRMPAMTWRTWTAVALAAIPTLLVLTLLAVAALLWLGGDALAERQAARRAASESDADVIELAHPAPARRVRYEAQHLAGR